MNLHQRERFLKAERNITTPTFDLNDDGVNNDMDFSTMIPPIGEESFAASHGGGEMELYEELGHALSYERCVILCYFFYYLSLMGLSRVRIDDRDRHDRTARLAYAWADQYEALVDAYLQFRLQNPSLACFNASIPPSENTFSIGVVDIFSEHTYFHHMYCILCLLRTTP
jgi:hypothetical protein